GSPRASPGRWRRGGRRGGSGPASCPSPRRREPEAVPRRGRPPRAGARSTRRAGARRDHPLGRGGTPPFAWASAAGGVAALLPAKRCHVGGPLSLGARQIGDQMLELRDPVSESLERVGDRVGQV